MLAGVLRRAGFACGRGWSGRFGGIGAVSGELLFGDRLLIARFMRFGHSIPLSPTHLAAEGAGVRNSGAQVVGKRGDILEKCGERGGRERRM